MMRSKGLAISLAFLAALGCAAAMAREKEMDNLLEYDTAGEAGGWARWFPREEVAPALDESAEDGGSLVVEGDGLEYCIGGWERTVEGFEPGDEFIVHAEVECTRMVNAPRSLWIRIYWRGDLPGGTAPDIVRISEGATAGEYVFDDRITVPEGASSALVRLIYRWEGEGRAVWKNVSMKPAPPEKPHRIVRISTLYWRATGETSIDNNFEHWLGMVDRAAADDPDIILIGEGAMIVGVGFADMDALSEQLPGGRFFNAFAEKAKEHGCYICYGTYERDGRYIFNTAALISPQGELVGKYRKSHLPTEEDVVGLSPGSGIEVFDTDLGRIGIIICIESAFPEIMRAAVLKGAEIVLVPIWGGDEDTIRVRAKENGVYVATSSFDMKCMVVDRRGNVMAETFRDLGTGVATADCDLDDRTKTPWTGNWPSYMMRMRWPELFGEITETGQ